MDQWLRLWLLGYGLKPKSQKEKYKGRFLSKDNYIQLLKNVFFNSSKLMKKNSVVYVRTDEREFTFKTTKDILLKCFPNHKMSIIKRPFPSKTQTKLFGNKSEISGEVDIILKS